MTEKPPPRIVALSGGVGGAKLALGLSKIMPGDDLMIIGNVGDDFNYMGLHISPDLDTLLYTLCGLNNPATGWGRRDETWSFMDVLAELGGETWFKLGDCDLALHVFRTRALADGSTLSAVIDQCARRFAISCAIVPVTDDSVRTKVYTSGGLLSFQTYFVRHQCKPVARDILYEGAETAVPTPVFLNALDDPDLAGIVLCPSNPFLSIDPILAIPGVRHAIRDAAAPVVAVSPIVQGMALKGPTAKIMRELGMPQTAAAVAAHYDGLIDGFIVDEADRTMAAQIADLGVAVHVTNSVMNTLGDRVGLARETVDFLAAL